MDASNESSRWSSLDAIHCYQVDRWGRDLFAIDDQGNLIVRTRTQTGSRVEFNLPKVVSIAAKQGYQAPLIVRFPGVIRQRINQLHSAFAHAIKEFGYRADYRFIYPIKVNQHAEVIDAVLQSSEKLAVGLESGSKAELLTVIARSTESQTILCNGFKDRSMIELAFQAKLIGKNIAIVIEKLSEIELIADVARQFSVRPRLGLRTKLGWQGAGHWKTTNGPRSKFGLTATQMLAAVEQLQKAGLLEHVHLLHFHPGSQINDVREIKTALTETTRIYVDLVQKGVPLDTIDVGGGLAIDYTGNQNRQPSSMNYTMQEYANDVIYYIQMVCDQAGIPHPHIYSESGRAITAHHSILVVPVFDSSQPAGQNSDDSKDVDVAKFTQTNSAADITARSTSATMAASGQEPMSLDRKNPDQQPLKELQDIVKHLDELIASKSKSNLRKLAEAYHDAQQALETVLQLFVNGHLTLAQRSLAESSFQFVCQKIRGAINSMEFVPDELIQMRDDLAQIYYANFSVFQSLPDFWALQHLFPVMPIHRLDERPSIRCVIGDITCDSDGQINRFLGRSNSHERSLLLHELIPDNTSAENNEQPTPYWLGIFLIGAYQEALSDDHNLLGKFHTICVDAKSDSGELEMAVWPGSDLREVVEHVNHQWVDLVGQFDQACDKAIERDLIDDQQAEASKRRVRSLADTYTYLDSKQQDPSNESADVLSRLDAGEIQFKFVRNPVSLSLTTGTKED